MTDKHLPRYLPRDTRDMSPQTMNLRRYKRLAGKSLKHMLLDRFLNHYGYDKGTVTASAIVDDLLNFIEHFYRFTDQSFLKQGQMVYHAVGVDEYPAKGKTIAQTKLTPVILDMITDRDLEAVRDSIHHREIRIKKIERWTTQAYDQDALLSQLDLALLLGVNEFTARGYVQEYESLYDRPLPTRGNVQLVGGGQTHKQDIIGLYLKGYLAPTIATKTNHSREAVERYIHDFEAVRLLAPKFDHDAEIISRIIRLAPRIVRQYFDLIPPDDD